MHDGNFFFFKRYQEMLRFNLNIQNNKEVLITAELGKMIQNEEENRLLRRLRFYTE